MHDFNKEEVLEIFNDLFDYESIDSDSIPDIYLYIDQVTTFIDKNMNSLKRNKKDKRLTKTMINNYTKEGILFPPDSKKYSKNHVKMIVLIYYLKQVLSINDIKSILKPVSDRIKNGNPEDIEAIEDRYDIFMSLEKFEREDFKEKLEETAERINKMCEGLEHFNNKSSGFLMIVDLVLQAQLRKTMAEKLIDVYFPSEDKK